MVKCKLDEDINSCPYFIQESLTCNNIDGCCYQENQEEKLKYTGYIREERWYEKLNRKRREKQAEKAFIPKTKVFYDPEELSVIKKQWLDIARKNCEKCSVCGGNLILQISYSGKDLRICCENYNSQALHGNPSDSPKAQRYTGWKNGENNLREAIDEWNQINHNCK